MEVYEIGTTEKLQAVKHANGRDWWLLTRNRIDTDLNASAFVRFLITPDGISEPYSQNYGPEGEWQVETFG